MPESYPFPIYSGLLEPTHYKKINSAIWLFLWCISSTTKEVERDGITWGIVLGNKPVKIDELVEQFGVNRSTIKRWIEILEEHGYIRVTRAPHGLIFTVRNSKKRRLKNEPSENSDGAKMSHQNESDSSEMSHQRCKNEPSNKDIIKINNNAAVVIKDANEILKLADEVAKHFVKRRGKGFDVSPTDFDEIKQMVADGVPIPIIKACIDKAFDEYRPRHKKDEIRSVTYCIPRCYDEWYRLQVDESITSPAVPHVGSVALGSPSRFREKPAKIVNGRSDLVILTDEERSFLDDVRRKQAERNQTALGP
ncbi:HTH domain-containing protein [Gordoniibacillus kamchatkensis]|uniref:HTH domain-containing protein n=1 Tax=Gordoniibacillus kamchatkensis TaxID=1590651 RepID=UPI000696E96B|nr:HTH domain-containing protein [Paenibacillus sp. VKM B-2647]